MMVIGGTSAAVIVAAGALTLANRDDEPAADRISPTETTVVAPGSTAAAPIGVTVPPTDAPQSTDAPATTEEPTTTTEAATTTVESTTTVAALPSFAGVYGVTTSEVTVTGLGVVQSLPGSGPTAWTLTGACDGVSDCTVTAEGGSASTGASPFAGPGGVLPLVPAGAGTYTSTFELFVDECGTGTGNIVMTLAAGTLTGSYDFAVSGGDCGFATLSMTFSGPLSG